MQVEMIGCTGAGKSTLAAAAINAGVRIGMEVVMSDEMILRTLHVHGVRARVARTLLVDLVALVMCILTVHRHWRYYCFALAICARSSGSFLAKLNLARNALRKIGILEFIRRFGNDDEVVLVDEGTLHAAHNLFVDVSGEDRTAQLDRFVELIPLPDAVVYLTNDESVLLERTLKRGHKRVPGGSRETVRGFIRRAVNIFERLRHAPCVAERLVVIDGPSQRVDCGQEDISRDLTRVQRLFVECVETFPRASALHATCAPATTVGASCPS